MKRWFTLLSLVLAVSAFAQAPDTRSSEEKKFIRAIGLGDSQQVLAMLKANPKLINAKTHDGAGVVLASAYSMKPKITKILIKHGAKLDIWAACAAGMLKEATWEVEKHKELIDKQSPDGNTPLCLAVGMGHPDVAKMLLEHGADHNARSVIEGAGPMNSAAFGRNLQCIKVLVEHGVDVNMAETDGSVALHESALHGDLEIIKYLVEHGANVKKANDEKMTPLMIAESAKQAKVVAYLKAHGA
ncbi:MAG: ankyrin repeat domain-containing protein [Armatimonadetes bacterium]|nr:ankyrin repeat domain-containing protein [Armatimonadota bacterium]